MQPPPALAVTPLTTIASARPRTKPRSKVLLPAVSYLLVALMLPFVSVSVNLFHLRDGHTKLTRLRFIEDVLPASSAFCEAINDGKTCDQSNNASSTSSWTVSETASSASLAASSNNGMIQSTTSASSSTSMSATSSITSSGSGVPNGPSPGSSGLTSAEKAGVGVGAGLGGVLLVALGFFLARIHSERTQDQDRTTGAESAGGGGLQHPAELVASPTIKPSELEQPPSRAHHDDMDWQDSLGQLPDQNVFEMTGSTPIRKPVELENFEKIANTDNIFGSIKPILV